VNLRVRLALFIALAVAMALLVQAFFGYLFFLRALESSLDRELQAVARRIARGAPIRPGRFPIRLVLDGETVYQDPRFPNLLPPQTSGGRWESGWRVFSQVLPNGRLEVARDANEALGFLATLRRAALLTALLVAGLGASVAFLLSGPALRPLTHLLRVVASVAESGNLGLRVPEEGNGELKELGQLFNRMLARLQGFFERERRFTQDASHELRTPLAAIQAQVEAYRTGYQSAEEALEAVAEEATRMQRLVESLLVLAREGQTARVPFDLAALAREEAKRSGASYQGPERLEVEGDPLLLRQAFKNLLDNAKKHAPGAPVEVRLMEGEEVVLEVADLGPGLPEEGYREAARPFWRAEDARAPGEGLGLSVVARVAEAHGGRLELLPNVPTGLRARIVLPR
jgi:Signal transduction histidine kinase